ncbi:MAG: succinyldiaminopimelate transaminase [Kineosporiaceae bacterium]
MTAPVVPGGLARGSLPDFPWDALAPYATTARSHPDGVVNLSVGTPVDRTPAVVRRALERASNAPGYPTTRGSAEVRRAVAGWFARRRGVPGLDPGAVLPTIGSKELVAWLPTLLGLGPGDLVVHPEVAYPTYDVGARLAGARPVPADGTAALGPVGAGAPVRLVWLNSPANPTGRVLGVDHLAKVVRWARSIGAVVASDECYAELGWEVAEVPSLLDPRVCGGDHEGLLAVGSLSKRSSLAGYRAGFVAGDPVLVERIHEVRRHAGMMVPTPVQAAMAVALDDDAHVAEVCAAYRARRELLRPALVAAGLRVEHSEAGLYLWATDGRDCWETVADLAGHGILVAPGAFYGPRGARHVRVALTATDERVAAAVARLTAG